MSEDNGINVTSINQSGGITAHTVNIGQKPPALSDENKIEILKLLPNKRAKIFVSAINGDNRAVFLAGQILSFLVKKNLYKLIGVNTVFVPLTQGVQIRKNSDSEYVIVVGLV